MKKIRNGLVFIAITVLLFSCGGGAPANPESMGKYLFDFMKNIEQKTTDDYNDLWISFAELMKFAPLDNNGEISEKELKEAEKEMIEKGFDLLKRSILFLIKDPQEIEWLDYTFEKVDMEKEGEEMGEAAREYDWYRGTLYFKTSDGETYSWKVGYVDLGRMKLIDSGKIRLATYPPK